MCIFTNTTFGISRAAGTDDVALSWLWRGGSELAPGFKQQGLSIAFHLIWWSKVRMPSFVLAPTQS